MVYRLGRVVAAVTVAVAAVAVVACSELPVVDPGTCGNLVVETGEACDGFAPAGQACGAADGPAACRFVCGDGATCPGGMGCGSDGECRAPADQFEVQAAAPLIGVRLALADLDGDGELDAIGQGGQGIGVRYGDGAGGFEMSGPLLSLPFVAAFDLGDLDGDGLPDLTSATDLGVVGFLGDPTRSLPVLPVAPVDAASFSSEVSNVRVAAVRYDDLLPLDTVLLVADGVGMCLVQWCGEVGGTTALPPGMSVADLRGAIAVADLDGGTDEVALSFIGHDRVYVYRVVRDVSGLRRVQLRNTVAVPGTLASEARFANVVGDGRLDLVVAIRDAGGFERVVAAAGNLTGFDPAAVDTGFDQLVSFGCSSRPWPLAMGSLNGDGFDDYVGDLAVCLGAPLNLLIPTAYAPFTSAWTRAELGDFNGDGRPDVIAAGAGSRRLDVLLQASSNLYSTRAVELGGELVGLSTGDHDGNGLIDVAVVVRDPTGDRVGVVFGRADGTTSPPVVMARYGQVDDLVALDLILSASTYDAASELIIISRPAPGAPEVTGSGLVGDGSQRMSSPFVLPGVPIPAVVVPGRYDSDADVDLFAGAVTASNGPRAIDQHQAFVVANDDGTLLGSATVAVGVTWPSFPLACTVAVRLARTDGDRVALVTGDGDDITPGCRFEPEAAAAPSVAVVVPAAAATGAPQTLPGNLRGRQALAAHDLDGDGLDDLVIGFTGVDGVGGGLLVVPGSAAGLDVAGARTVLTVPVYAVAAATGPDGVALAVRVDDGVWWYGWSAAGAGATVPVGRPATAPVAAGLRIGDVDRDGLLDVVLLEDGLLRRYRRVAAEP